MASSRVSNNLIGILNAITFLLSVPILAAGISLAARAHGTECERYLSTPMIVLGALLLVVSVAGLVGACCRVTWLLFCYLLAMFILIVVIFSFTVFDFVVTDKGAGSREVVVVYRGILYKEYRLADHSKWMNNRVQSSKNWNKMTMCLQDAKVCKSLQDKNQTWQQVVSSGLSPIQSGCCKPPARCGYTYVGGAKWTTTATNSTDPDCKTWSNDSTRLCYGCRSCKAGVVATYQRDWKPVAIVNTIFLSFIVIVYVVGCSAFRNNLADKAYHRGGGWKKAAADDQ